MGFKLPLSAQIAYRYLLSKKSYSAVNLISIVSICGVAVATMAIVCVLSVFNGFHDVLGGKLDQLSPDVMIAPAHGKVIENADSIVEYLESRDDVGIAMSSIEDNALAMCNRRQLPVIIKGVDEEKYRQMTSISKLVKDDGRYQLSPVASSEELVEEEPVDLDEAMLFADAELLYDDMTVSDTAYPVLISVGTAVSLKAYPSGKRDFNIFTPRRLAPVNMSNPATSFKQDSLIVSGVFQVDQEEYDKNMVIVDINFAKQMLDYDSQASQIEVMASSGVDASGLADSLRSALGDDYLIKDRLQQQELHFRMINIEKWVTFLLLAFILLIASFNIISTMSMLIVEKRDSILILSRLGASRKLIGKIFAWESCYVGIVGGLSGIALGLILCLLQQYFGLVKLNGDEASLIITSYPVKVLASDLPAVIVPIILISLLTSLISSHYAKSKLDSRD